MHKNIVILGSITGILGVLVCAFSGLARLLGVYWIMGFQSTTLFNAGVGLMVFACLVKLEELASRRRE
ncbi:MAG: hypothetical protein KDI09_15970 [Halioglobus sp.]|nr:hypothetical protein [Halioglobus sp.]